MNYMNIYNQFIYIYISSSAVVVVIVC